MARGTVTTHSVKRRRGLPAAVILLAAGLPTLGVAPARVDTSQSSCDQAAFRSAVMAGGTVTFTTGCTVSMTGELVIPDGLDMTVDATGGCRWCI